MSAIIKVREDGHKTGKLCFAGVGAAWAGQHHTRLFPRHPAPLNTSLFHSGSSQWVAPRAEVTSHHSKANVPRERATTSKHLCQGDKEAPATQHSPFLGPPTPLVASQLQPRQRQHPTREMFYLCPLWLSGSLPLLPERKGRIQTSGITLGGYSKFAWRVLPKLSEVSFWGF